MLIKIYKRYYNPLMGNRCIYTPSCSAYMGQAIKKRKVTGFFMGSGADIALCAVEGRRLRPRQGQLPR